MKRLTAEQVVGQLERDIDELVAMKTNKADWKASGIDYAAGVVAATLGPRWQGEPDEDQWCWVEGNDFPCYVQRTEPEDVGENGEWTVSGHGADGDGEDYRPLNGRRVCPIGERPEDGGAIKEAGA